ncbi:MAG TPA: DUF2339 domain-containing protein, partial [Kiloniellales bacterium]|nr:DUF2339 domain-containing protein [Kiloniellales bacterium]
FRRARADAVVTLLEAGALAFFVLLVSLEIRNLVTGPIAAYGYPLAERSLDAIAWLAIALGLERVAARHDPGGPNPVALWGWRVLAGVAAAQVILLQALLVNPLLTLEPIEGPVLFNIMTLAYLAPAGFAFVFAQRFRQSGQGALAATAGLIGLGLVWLDLSLEVRHAFHGDYLALGTTGDAELYAYSLVWLGYALGLLALALKTGIASLRYVSLGVLMVTTAKVFLIDMGSLTGLYRVASFLGLGLSLVGIGWLYQRFILPPNRPKTGRDGETPVTPA